MDATDRSTPGPRPSVVVVGAGFAGIEVVHALRHAAADVVLIDHSNHHLFQPLLYQVATAALSPAEVAWPIRHLFRAQPNVRVVLADATRVDLDGRRVRTTAGDFAYDRLVLATGSRPSYFGHEHWARDAPGLKSLADATAIRRTILLAFERAETETDPGRLSRLLTFVIIGGGPTGVEMAGAVAELARETLRDEFRRLNPEAARVVLLEAGPRILPSFPEHLSTYAAESLRALGVEVRVSTPVQGCDEAGVSIPGGRIEAATMIWGAGVSAAKLTEALPVERDRSGRVRVAPNLSLPGRPDVFVIGDAAAVIEADGRPVPGLAPAAKQMGRYVGRLIAAGPQAGRPPFHYRHEGDLATIGRDHAVVKLGRLELTGFPGWIFWGVAHIWFLIGVRSRIAVAGDWIWGYLSKRRAARLIVWPYARPGEPAPTSERAPAREERPAPAVPAERPYLRPPG